MKNFSRDDLIDRAFLRVAMMMHGMWEEKGSSDTRLLENWLIPDDFVTVGESLAGTDHREHVVPRMMLCEKAHAMFRDGASIEDVASFLRRFLKIVLISRAEQQRLDNKDQLNLRQKMPDGWSFESGDVFARLAAADIKFRLYEK